MKDFKVRCPTVGENVLAQKMLFRRGYKGADGRKKVLCSHMGVFLYTSNGEILYDPLALEGAFRADKAREVTLSDIAAIPIKEN